ncbi:MAG: hypothetical protein AAGG75_07600 [Bacteroidota bacterium]
MKIRILLWFSLLLGANALLGQVSEEERVMSLGLNNAVVLEMPDTEEKFVEKLWKKFIKPYKGKTKRNRKADEWMTDDAAVVGIGGANAIDIYAQFASVGDDVELAMWVDMGGAFLSSYEHPSPYLEAEKLLMRFALYAAKETTRLELEAEEKRMKKLKSTLKKLERDNERYHREIEQAKARIARAEDNIDANVIEQGDTRQLIELQKEAILLVKKRLDELDN